jgi:hypothetical protein
MQFEMNENFPGLGVFCGEGVNEKQETEIFPN